MQQSKRRRTLGSVHHVSIQVVTNRDRNGMTNSKMVQSLNIVYLLGTMMEHSLLSCLHICYFLAVQKVQRRSINGAHEINKRLRR